MKRRRIFKIYMYEDKDLFVVDFSNVKRYDEMHRVIKAGLDFPDGYAENWESFWECISDICDVGLNFVFRGVEVLRRLFPDSAKRLIECLTEYKRNCEYGYCMTVKIQEGDKEYYLN